MPTIFRTGQPNGHDADYDSVYVYNSEAKFRIRFIYRKNKMETETQVIIRTMKQWQNQGPASSIQLAQTDEGINSGKQIIEFYESALEDVGGEADAAIHLGHEIYGVGDTELTENEESLINLLVRNGDYNYAIKKSLKDGAFDAYGFGDDSIDCKRS